jgi:hypothetical protein
VQLHYRIVAVLLVATSALSAQETNPPNPLSGQTATTQQAKERDCTLQGTVVSSVGRTPIRKATVQLISNGEGEEQERDSVITDADGRFSFSEIPSGRYLLLVSHAGYVASLRPNRAVTTTYTLAPGQEIKDAVVRLIPAAVVRGRIVDEDGDPVSQVQAQAITAGKSGSAYIGPEVAVTGATADDQGNFRIFGIAPGQYYVKVIPATDFSTGALISNKAQSENVPTYYPGATSRKNATALDLRGGEEIAVNIVLQRANVYPVSGMLTDARGAPVQLGMVTVMQGMQGVMGGVQVRAGKFELRLPPGHYVITGMAMDQAGGKFVASGEGVGTAPSEAHKRIDVTEGGVRNIVLNLSPEHASRVQVNGRIRVEDGRPLPKEGLLFVAVAPMEAKDSDESDTEAEDEPDPFNRHDSGSGFAFVTPDGTFHIENVPEGTYLLRAGSDGRGIEDWYTKSVLLAGHDVLNSGIPVSDSDLQLDVVLSPKGGSLEGFVKDKDDQPVTASTVVIIPDAARAKRRYLYQTAETDQNGHFVMSGLEPGSYMAYAFDDEQPQIWFSSEAMKRYKDDGFAITISAAEKAHAELHLVKTGQAADGSP